MMSFRPWHGLAIGGALTFIALAFLGPGAHREHGSGPTASTSARSAASAARALAEPKAPPRLPFVFDCQQFAIASSKPCGSLPADEQTLLDLANIYRMPPVMTWSTELGDRFATALAKLAKLDAQKLAPLEKAALQNAALTLLSRSVSFQKDKSSHDFGPAARGLIKKLALSPAELAELPSSSAVAGEWLGAESDWHQGTDTVFMHTASDGYARVHRQLQRTDAVADVVRMALVNEAGAPFVSDLVQRIVIRRSTADGVHVCIAELDPLSASCSTSGVVRALEPGRGGAIVKPTTAAVPCFSCHVNNTPKAVPYGPKTGFQLNETSALRVKAILQRALGEH